MPRKTKRAPNYPRPRARHLRRKEVRSMSGRGFFRRLVRNLLRLTAALLTIAAFAYLGGLLWTLELPAPRYPVLPAPKIHCDRLVLPFSPRAASVSRLQIANRQPRAIWPRISSPPANPGKSLPARGRHSRCRPILFAATRLLPRRRRHGKRLHGRQR